MTDVVNKVDAYEEKVAAKMKAKGKKYDDKVGDNYAEKVVKNILG